MKKILLSLAVLSSTLFSLPGSTAGSDTPAARPPAHLSVALNEVRAGAPTPQLRLAAIGDPATTRASSLHDTDRAAEKPAAEGLPSTPVALGCLLLIFCILVGRRNGRERI